MSFLIDTNVISELRKGTRCDPAVANWYATVTDTDLYLSVLVTGEIRKGIEGIRPRDKVRAVSFERWLTDVEQAFGDRILPVDRATADAWGRMSARRSVPVIDGLLAAQANVFGLTLVTRNNRDIVGLAEQVLNPWRMRSES